MFNWYQQLIAESLGKKSKGILPVVSSMPKDNHSVMQLFLDGFKNNFFTFFFVKENNSTKIKKIPFRSFEINRRDEKTLGELFCFFILETILIGNCLNINPFNQPAVELKGWTG